MGSTMASQSYRTPRNIEQLGIDPATILTGAGSVAQGFTSLFGGGKEAGYGLTQPGTLPWYIDKLKGIDDNQAIQIADELRAMVANGAPNQTIQDYLKTRSSEKVLGPEEYNPIIRSVRQEYADFQASQSTNTRTSGTASGFQTPANLQQNQLPVQAASIVPANFDSPAAKWIGGGLALVLVGSGIVWAWNEFSTKKSKSS